MNTYLDQEDLPHINRFSNAIENTNMMGRPSSLTRQNIEQSKFNNQQNEFYSRGGISEIVPLVDDDYKRDIGTNIKKGFIAAIGNVFGAGQPSTAMIAENVNMMQNNLQGLSYFDAPQQSSSPFFQNQFDDLNCMNTNSIQRATQQQQMGAFQPRTQLFEDQPFNCAFDTGMAVQEDVFKVPEQVPVINKIQSENIQIQKQASSEICHQTLLTANFKSVEQTQSQEMINDCSSTPSKKKRSLKAQTKKQSKKSDSKQEVIIPLSKQSMSLPQMLMDHESSYDNEFSMSKYDKNLTEEELQKLTNKKKEYLQDAIIDKNGAYSYLDDPLEYKKARKRLQNRESAVRSRQRKKNYQEELEDEIHLKDQLIASLKYSKNQFEVSNKQLLIENTQLKSQLRIFQDSCADSILVGSVFDKQIEEPKENDYEKQLAELLKKINYRFQQENDQMSLNGKEFEHFITGEKSEKRQRLDSNSQINADDSSYTLETVSEKSCYKETQVAKNSSKGYLRMALVLGMMACSSIAPETKSITAQQEVSMDFDDQDIEQSFVKMNLIAQQTDSFNTNDSDKALSQTAHMMKTFKKNKLMFSQPADNSANLIKTLVNGKYSYLAKSMANTASFGFWITPNQHKLRNIKPRIIQKSNMEF